ncbi:MAG: VWA domain-containing protein [Spirochaetales bacterium]|nr:VWA domain-containing protein [Spirochaetales bacterium]
MWSLEHPFSLLLFLILPFLIYFVHFRKKRGGVILFNFNIWKNRKYFRKIHPGRIFNVFFWVIFWCGFCSYIIALGGPHMIEKERIYLTKGIDIIIVLDESGSMSTPDFEPGNRFESAKRVINQFTHSRENDQIGLVTFSSDAILRVPPTLDYTMLEEQLQNLTLMELGEETAIGMGIAVAALHLKSSRALNKIIILITDGVNNTGRVTPEQAALLASRTGIRIYTIGIGRTSDSEWTYKDLDTGIQITGLSGEFDEYMLMKIAQVSGGKYFYAGNPRSLNSIFEEIDSVEKTEKRFRINVKRIPYHELFILVGLLCIFTSYLGRRLLLKEIF